MMTLTDKRFVIFKVLSIAFGLLTLLSAFSSCNDRNDLTDTYSVFTYGEGLYGESEND